MSKYTINKENMPVRIIFNPGLAKHLIKVCGYELIDIRPNHQDPNRSVFVFKTDANFQRCIDEYSAGIDRSNNYLKLLDSMDK